jgi:anti-anti-sigma factor
MQATGTAIREIDLATAPAFLESMCDAIESATDRTVFVDCSDITFMDSSAVHAFFDARDHALRHDRVLVIRGLAENCARVVCICDPRKQITIEA